MTKSSWIKVLETGLFGAVGVIAEIQEVVPKTVEKGRAVLEPKLNLARIVGQFATEAAEKGFRGKADEMTSQIGQIISVLLGTNTVESASKVSTGVAPVEGSVSSDSVETPKGVRSKPRSVPDSSATLPISGYRALSAQQVIARLESLNAAELGQIAEYERSHRNRSSVIASIEAMRSKR